MCLINSALFGKRNLTLLKMRGKTIKIKNYEENTFVFSIVRYLGDGVFKLSVLEAGRRLLYSVCWVILQHVNFMCRYF